MEGGAGDKPCQMQEFMQTERENVCKPCQRQPRSQSCWSRSSESPTFLLSADRVIDGVDDDNFHKS